MIKVRAGVRVRIKVDEEPKCNIRRAVPKPEVFSYNQDLLFDCALYVNVGIIFDVS